MRRFGKNQIAGLARFVFPAASLWAATASAATYYVATNGVDTNLGTTTNAPWRTIQKAANALVPGDTVLVRDGVYNEAVTVNVSGSSAANPVTFQNYPGEAPVVDGTGLAVPDEDTGLFLVTSRSNLTIQGFEIRNYQANSDSLVPAGIWINGTSAGLNIISNNIHDIVNTNAAGNAFGIAVYGDSTAATITNLVFRGNEVHNLKTGNSESFTLNGNVSGFEVNGNLVHDNWNIGIDFIGYEKVCANTNLDYARNGVCRGNIVWNCSTFANPSYAQYSCAGIYADGGSNVLIELNQVYNCDIGVEMASEHKGHAANACVCRDNLIWSNSIGGIYIGGYDTTVGQTLNCVITHNTLYQNDTTQSGSGEWCIQYYTVSNIFTHNILFANSQGLLIGNPFTQNTNNFVDWNLYFMSGDTNNNAWQWKNIYYTTFAEYKSATANDTHSIFADPRFVLAGNTNFHISINSPAFNAGDPAFQSLTNQPAETDMDLQPRIAFGRTDIGADELNILSASLVIAPLNLDQIFLQVCGEPGHPFVLEQSSVLSNWLPLLTNYSDASGSIGITNPASAAATFFRARMAQ